MTTSKETPEEKASRIGVPLIQRPKAIPMDPNRTIGICGKCGREVKQIEYAYCSDSQCPVYNQTTLGSQPWTI